jgi:hypothetical protein
LLFVAIWHLALLFGVEKKKEPANANDRCRAKEGEPEREKKRGGDRKRRTRAMWKQVGPYHSLIVHLFFRSMTNNATKNEIDI